MIENCVFWKKKRRSVELRRFDGEWRIWGSSRGHPCPLLPPPPARSRRIHAPRLSVVKACALALKQERSVSNPQVTGFL